MHSCSDLTKLCGWKVWRHDIVKGKSCIYHLFACSLHFIHWPQQM